MEVTAASYPGPGVTNQDGFHITTTMAVVLDGLSAPTDLPMGCTHGTPWLVRQLGTRIMGLADGTQVPLADALAATIDDVNALHRDECDLNSSGVPASTVVAIRQRGSDLDYLVLSDSVLLLDLSEGLHVISDKRVDEVAREQLEAALATPIGSSEHNAEVANLITAQRPLRNTPGGYWVAATDPEASFRSYTGTVPLHQVRRTALLTDGATRMVDTFGAVGWPELLNLLEEEGPSSLIRRTRELEVSDPKGLRWPRFKQSDDATALIAIWQ